MNTQLVDVVLAQTREYFEGTSAQPQQVRVFEVASESPDDLEEIGLYLFGTQHKKT